MNIAVLSDIHGNYTALENYLIDGLEKTLPNGMRIPAQWGCCDTHITILQSLKSQKEQQ